MMRIIAIALLSSFVVTTTMTVASEPASAQQWWIKKAIKSVEKCRAKGKCR